jgi:hypothetical protein
MRRFSSAAIVVAATFLWLGGLFALRPFQRACHAMDRVFGHWEPWAHVQNTFSDPLTQEMSHGGAPLRSFQILAGAWGAKRGAVRMVLMGNSQTLTANLAPGEAPPSGPEKTYTDHIADYYRQAGSHTLFYRLAAGGLSYEEMLWYTVYLAGRAELKPDVLLVQLNYQSLASSGIRGGMLEMLSDAAFRGRVEEIAGGTRPDCPAFAKAISDYEELQRRHNTPDADAAGATPGYRLETAVRKELGRIPGFDRRGIMKESFEAMLLRGRYYILRLSSDRKRSLGGSRVNASRAALEDLAGLCARSGIRLILFQAPTNPAVPLYATPEDDRSYHGFATSLAARHGLTLLDFEHCIPATNWGRTLNDPDPLHLGRAGHRQMADLMITALQQSGL